MPKKICKYGSYPDGSCKPKPTKTVKSPLVRMRRDLRTIDRDILFILYEARDYKAGKFEAKGDLKESLPNYSANQLTYALSKLEERGDIKRVIQGVYTITQRGLTTLQRNSAEDMKRIEVATTPIMAYGSAEIRRETMIQKDFKNNFYDAMNRERKNNENSLFTTYNALHNYMVAKSQNFAGSYGLRKDNRLRELESALKDAESVGRRDEAEFLIKKYNTEFKENLPTY